MVGQKEVTLQLVGWNAEAAHLLRGAVGDNPTYTLEDMELEVRTGDSELYAVYQGSEKLGYCVLWVEDFGGTNECVIQAGEAFYDVNKATVKALPVIERWAKARNCQTMRIHSSHPHRFGSIRKAGFRKTEVVFQKVIP